jgi:hypothetical protein
MKRLLLILVLAVALSGLLAAPAFAQPPLHDGVYMWIYDGSWFQVSGGEQVLFGDPGAPIPAGQPVWLVTAWAAYGRGHVQSVASLIVEKLSIDGRPVVATTAASKALWSVPYPSAALATETTPFNPRMRISGWVAVWLCPVTLGPGTYEVTGTETYTHPATDLTFWGGHHAQVYPPGSGDFGPWDLVLP